MVALLAGKGLALAAGKPLIAVNHLEGHALSAAPGRSRPRLSLSAAARVGRPLPAARSARASATIAGSRRPSTMPPARRSTRPPSCSAWPIPAARRSRRWRTSGDPTRGAAAAPAGRLGRAAFLLRRPQERGAARGRIGRASRREDIAASFQQAVVDCLVDRTALRARDERCAGAGRRRRSRRQPGDPHRARRPRRARRAAASACRPAGCAPTMRR